MPDYQRGKIYKIISPHTDKCYVGSTALQYLSSRMAQHRQDFRRGVSITSSEIIKLGDYEIVLLELCPCNSKDELHMRERHYMETLDCVNNKNVARTILEKVEIQRICNKTHRMNNKEYHKKRTSDYYEKNKDSLKQKRKERDSSKITCECGCIISRANTTRHKKSKRHLDLIQSSL
tara:strand:+ start:52 stop:582 length:531 start_codon:yes stop_codon:yes gene_type:complete